MKHCIKCNQDKPKSEFSKYSRHKDGLSTYCKDCMKVYFKRLSAKPKVKPETKVCRTCGLEKPSESFSKVAKSLDGLNYQCRDCGAVENNKKLLRDKQEPTAKACTTCGEIKEPCEFGEHSYTYDGLSSECKICMRVRCKDYASRNKDKIKVKNAKRLQSLKYRLESCFRSRLKSALMSTGRKKKLRTLATLGATLQEAKDYLESKFQRGMTWDNFGRKGESEGWVIDHVVPITYFDLGVEAELLMACNFRNIQPMWDNLNSSKNGKMNWSHPDYESPLDKLKELEEVFGYTKPLEIP